MDDGTIDTVLQRILDQQETEPPEVRQAREILKKVQKQIASLVCAIRDGAYHPALREELQKLTDEEERLNKILASAEDLPLPSREEITAFLQKAQNIKKLSRDEQKRIIADLVDEIVVRDSGDKYLTFRIFHVPMAKDTSLIQYAPSRFVPVCRVNTLSSFRLFRLASGLLKITETWAGTPVTLPI